MSVSCQQFGTRMSRRLNNLVPPRAAGRYSHPSGAAVADGGLAILDDGGNLSNPAVGLKHLL